MALVEAHAKGVEHPDAKATGIGVVYLWWAKSVTCIEGELTQKRPFWEEESATPKKWGAGCIVERELNMRVQEQSKPHAPSQKFGDPRATPTAGGKELSYTSGGF